MGELTREAAAEHIGVLAQTMLELAPTAGLIVKIKIEAAPKSARSLSKDNGE